MVKGVKGKYCVHKHHSFLWSDVHCLLCTGDNTWILLHHIPVSQYKTSTIILLLHDVEINENETPESNMHTRFRIFSKLSRQFGCLSYLKVIARLHWCIHNIIDIFAVMIQRSLSLLFTVLLSLHHVALTINTMITCMHAQNNHSRC